MSITAHRGSRAFYSERDAWEDVRGVAQAIQRAAREIVERHRMQTVIGQLVDELVDVSAKMRKQLSSAHPHENPPLTVFALANPPRGKATLVSDHLYAIEYRHTANGRDYYHDFKPGTQLLALPDGSILIRRTGAKVWEDLPG